MSDTDHLTSKYSNVSVDFNFYQFINGPTHVQNNCSCNTCISHIYVNNYNPIDVFSCIIKYSITGHFYTKYCDRFNKSNNNNYNNNSSVLIKCNKLNQSDNTVNWKSLLIILNPNVSIDVLIENIEEYVNINSISRK